MKQAAKIEKCGDRNKNFKCDAAVLQELRIDTKNILQSEKRISRLINDFYFAEYGRIVDEIVRVKRSLLLKQIIAVCPACLTEFAVQSVCCPGCGRRQRLRDRMILLTVFTKVSQRHLIRKLSKQE